MIAGLKVRDIDPKAATIAIHRRGDDPDDPRIAPPRAKTSARAFPCDTTLIHDLEDYVLHVRRNQLGAMRHPFLFVAHRGAASGAPLSVRQIGKIFEALSSVLGFHVHAHLLRHAKNDRCSEMQDTRPNVLVEAWEKGIDDAEAMRKKSRRRGELKAAKGHWELHYLSRRPVVMATCPRQE